MTSRVEKIPFRVEISRVIEVLATQIYQTPLALLRENAQNAFDAILLRRHLAHTFEASIEITVTPTEIRVSDNGIGMTADDLRNHYWRAGSSSKNNPDARAAGVVGTFGIGAMANFGIAEELVVITESAVTGERWRCVANRSTLSATEDCIVFAHEESTGFPGTTVIATAQSGSTVNPAQARAYIADFVALLDITVTFNQEVLSRRRIEELVRPVPEAWRFRQSSTAIGPTLRGDVDLVGAGNGEMSVTLTGIEFRDQSVPGLLALRHGVGALRTYRSGFGLATTSVQSAYQFGGIADFLFLEPTAGREALTTESMQLLQSIITQIDDFASAQLATREECDSSTPFMAWITHKKRYELSGNLKIRQEPGESLLLSKVREQSGGHRFFRYGGADQSVIQTHASDENPLLVLARSNPRRQCEREYLTRFCNTEEVSDSPRVVDTLPHSSWSLAHSGLAFRAAAILSADYFLDAVIQFGRISHDLPVLVDKSAKPVTICLNPAGATTRLLLDLYTREYRAFDSMTKDFVRNLVFPRIADLVPSSTRAGAEAFLKTIQRPREFFEYEASDLQSLTSIWGDYLEGKLTMQEAARRSTRLVARSVQVIESSAAALIREVVPDVIENEQALQSGADQSDSREDAAPPIERRELQTEAKLLTIEDAEPALRGFRCFLSLSDRVREERGDFFLQPHRTSIVWGGQKALFVFEHHSGRFGLYYELQTPDLLSHPSGGGPYPTSTIVTKNRIYIPVPGEIQASFLPQTGERKRLEVGCDILYTDASGS